MEQTWKHERQRRSFLPPIPTGVCRLEHEGITKTLHNIVLHDAHKVIAYQIKSALVTETMHCKSQLSMDTWNQKGNHWLPRSRNGDPDFKKGEYVIPMCFLHSHFIPSDHFLSWGPEATGTLEPMRNQRFPTGSQRCRSFWTLE